MDFKRNTDVLREQAENAAKEELKNYSDIPEHYSVIMKYPNMDAKEQRIFLLCPILNLF